MQLVTALRLRGYRPLSLQCQTHVLWFCIYVYYIHNIFIIYITILIVYYKNVIKCLVTSYHYSKREAYKIVLRVHYVINEKS